MDKDKVNVLFVCGYGVGSSAMAATLVKRGLDKLGVQSDLKHTAAGEAQGYSDWVDVVAVSKAFVSSIRGSFEGKHMIEVENIMDGDGIASKIYDIVKEEFPNALDK